jgi:hypothetical protein
MNDEQAVSLAKNLGVFWIGLVLFNLAVFLFLHLDKGSPIHPDEPIPTSNLEQGISQATDFPTLQKLCMYLARERDADKRMTNQIIENYERVLVICCAFTTSIGAITGFMCIRLWAFLRTRSGSSARGV